VGSPVGPVVGVPVGSEVGPVDGSEVGADEGEGVVGVGHINLQPVQPKYSRQIWQTFPA